VLDFPLSHRFFGGGRIEFDVDDSSTRKEIGMSAEIPESHRHLLTDNEVYPKLATIMPNGRPQVHQVWSDYDGEYVRVNSAKGRQKDENLRERRYATLLYVDPEDPYFWVEVRGQVVEVIEGPEAEAHIDSLAQKYMGRETYPGRTEGMIRVKYVIEPNRVVTYGERT
jgi:PPOX class probable F420-dependent enzyme